jgi:hypothetical protein
MRNVLAVGFWAGLVLFACPVAGTADTLHVSDDAFVNLSQPGQNHGAQQALWVDNVAPGGERRTLVRFDLTPLAFPAGNARVGRCVLRVWINAVPHPGSVELHLVTQTWDEGSVTAATAPTLGPALATVPVASAQAGHYLTFDVTSQVKSWLEGTYPNFGAAILPGASAPVTLSMDSKEDTGTSHPPELEVVTLSELSLPFEKTIASDRIAFSVTNTGTGPAGLFRVDNTASSQAALGSLSNAGPSLLGLSTGRGPAAVFANLDAANTAGTVVGFTRGLGTVGGFLSANQDAVEPTVLAGNAGRGPAGRFFTLNPQNLAPALEASSSGLGNAVTAYGSDHGSALYAHNDASGDAINAYITGSGSRVAVRAMNDDNAEGHVLEVLNRGTNNALYVGNHNTQNQDSAIYAWTRGSGQGVTGLAGGGGSAVHGAIWDGAGDPPGYSNQPKFDGLRAAVSGLMADDKGNAGLFRSTSADNISATLYAVNEGGGIAIAAQSQVQPAIWAVGGIRVAGLGDFRKADDGTALRAWGLSGAQAASFWGDVEVVGELTKSSGGFKIDHPLDPEAKYLLHSFVESPEMANVYSGNVRLGADGQAWVDLPAYFEALNKDIRYQLTPLGGAAPELHVAQKVSGNRFRIAGGRAGLEVSWQVTGVRRDPYAEKHRLVPEQLKQSADRGRYLHPEAWGKSVELTIGRKEALAVADETAGYKPPADQAERRKGTTWKDLDRQFVAQGREILDRLEAQRRRLVERGDALQREMKRTEGLIEDARERLQRSLRQPGGTEAAPPEKR